MILHRALALLTLLLAISSCAPSEGPTAPEPPAPAVATSLQVGQSSVALTALGDSSAVTATVRDQRGQTMSGQTVVWSAAPAGIVTVSAAGWVKSVAVGTATVTATVGSLTASVPVTVTQVPASVTVSESRLAFSSVDASDTATAVVRDARGAAIPAATIVWTTANASVATVSGAGVVTATGAGSTTVTASVGTLSAAVRVTVNVWGSQTMQVIAELDGALMNFPDGWTRQWALTDFDDDGNEDVVVNAWASCAVAGCGTALTRNPRGEMRLLRRAANGAMEDITLSRFSAVPQVWVNSAVVADFNGDRFPDLVLPGFTDVPSVDAPSEVYMSNGAGYTLTSDATQIWAHGALAVDADRDGCLDVLVGTNRQPLWKGNCGGGFTKMQFADPQILPMQGVERDLHLSGNAMGICSGDFNRDGSTDIVYTDANVAIRSTGYVTHPADNVVVEVNWTLPRPQYTRVHSLPVPYFDRASTPGQHRSHDMRCLVGDLDRDGDEDIFVSSTPWALDGNWGGSAWQVYLNDGNFSFRDVSATAFPGRTTAMGFGFNPLLRDLNGDGILDLLFSGMANSASETLNPAWLGNGDGTFRISAAVDFNALRQQAQSMLEVYLDAPSWARNAHGVWGEMIPLRRATGEYDFIATGLSTSFDAEPGSEFGRPTAYYVFIPAGVRF